MQADSKMEEKGKKDDKAKKGVAICIIGLYPSPEEGLMTGQYSVAHWVHFYMQLKCFEGYKQLQLDNKINYIDSKQLCHRTKQLFQLYTCVPPLILKATHPDGSGIRFA